VPSAIAAQHQDALRRGGRGWQARAPPRRPDHRVLEGRVEPERLALPLRLRRGLALLAPRHPDRPRALPRRALPGRARGRGQPAGAVWWGAHPPPARRAALSQGGGGGGARPMREQRRCSSRGGGRRRWRRRRGPAPEAGRRQRAAAVFFAAGVCGLLQRQKEAQAPGTAAGSRRQRGPAAVRGSYLLSPHRAIVLGLGRCGHRGAAAGGHQCPARCGVVADACMLGRDPE
jgi:hypothetical protein